MVLRVKPTPTRFPTNSLYTPMDKTPLHSSQVCATRGACTCCTRLKSTLLSLHWNQMVFEQFPIQDEV